MWDLHRRRLAYRLHIYLAPDACMPAAFFYHTGRFSALVVGHSYFFHSQVGQNTAMAMKEDSARYIASVFITLAL